MLKTRFLITIIYSFLINGFVYSQSIQRPEINVVYGEKHIFTVETPTKWINDKPLAQKYGLVCFFYAKKDSLIKQKSYIYAHGIDKASSDENLDNFIKGDLKKYKEKYPDFKYENIQIGYTDGIINGKFYCFSNLSDRFKEEVAYMETESSFLIFSFSATTESDYNDYQPIFDSFVESFEYRGDNPQPFLDYMKNSQKK